MSLGEILDRTIQIYRKNFLLFAGTAFLPTLLVIVMAVGAGVIGGLMGRMNPDFAGVVGSLAILLCFLLFAPLSLAGTAMVNGALTSAAVSVNEGEKLTIRAALGAAWKRGWRYIGTQFFVWLIAYVLPGVVIIGLILLFGALTALLSVSGSDTVGAILVVLLVLVCLALTVYVVLAMIRLSLAFAAATKEELGPWESVKRSYQLTNESMGRIFLFGLLVYALTVAVTIVIVIIAMIPLILVGMMMEKSGSVAQQQMMVTVFFICYYGGAFLAQVVVKPVYSIGLTVFYFDQRVRKEGYDIERMMEQAGLVDANAAQVTVATDATPATWFDQAQSDIGKTGAQERTGGEQ
jgi:hypothetical protein